MARQSRASCQRCIDILAVPMSKWAGVRYLRVALEQKCRGVMKLDLGQLGTQGEQGEGGEGAAEASPEVMPDKLSEWLASSRHGDDGESIMLLVSLVESERRMCGKRLVCLEKGRLRGARVASRPSRQDVGRHAGMQALAWKGRLKGMFSKQRQRFR